ncbi:MAG: SDR family oxidoreductase [Chitinophagales bacterium]|nr:SDR family oxidoreductase [Chitinophagales bacterium]
MSKFNILVTGASRGIGFAIAEMLLPKSSHLLICSKHSQSIDNAEKILQKKTANAQQVFSTHFDNSDAINAAKHISEWANKVVSSIDLLVLNAGYYVEGTLEDITHGDFDENIKTNFSFNHYLIQELIPLIEKSSLKRIVVIGSTAAYESYASVPSYSVAKWALRGYTINLRIELSSKNIGVTFLAPGATKTDMWEGVELPIDRLLLPSDIAKVVDFITTLSSQAVVDEIVIKPMLGDLHE